MDEEQLAIAETVKAMDCEKLADMLKQVLTDRNYQKDLQKLIDENIDGKLFLELFDHGDRAKLLKELKLSLGGKAHIEEIVKKMKDGTFELPQAGGRKLLEPDMAWCTTCTVAPTDTSTNSGNARTMAGDGMQSAWIPADAVWSWKECKEIYVQFRNVEYLINWTIGNGQPMNTLTILHYANTWNRMGGEKIPLFVEATKGHTADIRVSFNNDQIRNSQLGKRAQNVKITESTMNLDLHNGCPDDDYKKHVIIHEFGHALGLGHEHQRSIFWACIKPFTNIDKMKHDLNVTDKQFDIDWKEVDTSEVGPHSLGYDPDSIMHYWFKVEWLINDYSDEQKVKRDRELDFLSEKEAKALLGVHKRRQVLAKEPSTDDIELLKKVYGGPSQTAVPSGAVLEQEYGDDAITNGSRAPAGGRRTAPDSRDIIENYNLDVTNHYLSRMEYVENGTKKEVRIYDESAHMWSRIGENLGIEGGVLTSIKRDGHDDRERVVKVLGKWYENANGLPHADEYPMTWKGLINLLKNSDLNRLAEKVRKALTPHKRSGTGTHMAQAPPMPQPEIPGRQGVNAPGQYLSDRDLITVKEAVWDARAKWNPIGLNLGILPGDLDTIASRRQNDPDHCFSDVLTQFLQQVNPKPSWKRLADALASKTVGRGDIAEDLRRK